MVNSKLLKEHIAKYPIKKDTAAEFHKQLFKLHSETAKYYDAEDIDPDSIPRSQKFQRLGAQEIRSIFNLASEVDDERAWNGSVKNLISMHKEANVPFSDFQKALPAVLKIMEVHAGGCNDEQKKAWTELFEKLFATMKGFGYQ